MIKQSSFQVWKDFKFKLRKKLLLKEAEDKGMGGGKLRTIILFPLEKAAAKLICYENQFYSNEKSALEFQPPIEENYTIWEEEESFEPGDQSMLEEVKTEDYGMMDQTLLGDEEYLPSPSTHSFQVQMLPSPDTKKSKRTSKSERQHELLESHSAMQKKVFYEISSTINELKTIVKDSAYCQRKMLDIEKQKLEIMQRRNEREEQLFKTEMKLKLLEMKIKTRELEALEKQSKS